MKKLIILVLLLEVSAMFAALADYEEEFGFPMDKPRRGRYFFQRELLTIQQDPQIMTYNPARQDESRQEAVINNLETELDRIELSDSTLVLNTNALNDLDQFSALEMDSSIEVSGSLAKDLETDFSFVKADPADYNLYSRMEVPLLDLREESKITFVPVTKKTAEEKARLAPTVYRLAYEIDDIYERENMILPQSGSIDFIITIEETGVTDVDYRITGGRGFSQGFIRKCQQAVRGWELYSPLKLQLTLSRNYLSRR